jgi:hypothetical protein
VRSPIEWTGKSFNRTSLISTCGNVFRLSILDFVGANAILTGNENHPSRHQLRHVNSVVFGTRNQRILLYAEFLGREA